MEKLLVSVITLGFLLCLATGCSIPEGGFTDPSMEDLVHYSDIVVVGRVTEIIDDPSFWGSTSYVDTTYGAKVDVRCSYKGGVLPRIITIGEAGYIPAMCFSYDLELNREYILFLRHPIGYDFYVQSEVAEPVTKLHELTNVCDLALAYPILICTEQVSSPYIEHAMNGLLNPTCLEGELSALIIGNVRAQPTPPTVCAMFNQTGTLTGDTGKKRKNSSRTKEPRYEKNLSLGFATNPDSCRRPPLYRS